VNLFAKSSKSLGRYFDWLLSATDPIGLSACRFLAGSFRYVPISSRKVALLLGLDTPQPLARLVYKVSVALSYDDLGGNKTEYDITLGKDCMYKSVDIESCRRNSIVLLCV
jgi:hypothetical protein